MNAWWPQAIPALDLNLFNGCSRHHRFIAPGWVKVRTQALTFIVAPQLDFWNPQLIAVAHASHELRYVNNYNGKPRMFREGALQEDLRVGRMRLGKLDSPLLRS
nr:hypothetical protein [Comamonas testosteroni]